MQRSRLKNIIAKSKELSNQTIGEPYDLFVKSLPSELDYYKDGGKYRLKAAWESYGKPKDLYEARWNGLVESVNGNLIMPSIGYNEQKDQYEYLNIGKENDTVSKDIRAWDNDVIPFIKELKLGGYVRTFNEQENCWTYSKNSQENDKQREEINSFKKGGKAKDLKNYKEFIKYIIDSDRNGGHYDYESFWNDEEARNKWIDEEDKNPGKAHFTDKYKLPTHPTFSTESKYSNSVTEGGKWVKDEKGNWSYATSPYVEARSSLEDMQRYFNEHEPGVTLIYKGVPYGPLSQTPYFKQGGQMNVIPEGALHAHKNHMELAEEGEVTKKGIPVVDNEGNQQAEVEREEWTISKSLTEDIEKWCKKFYSDESLTQKEKDELAIKCGKRICEELLHNTDDRVGLIEKMENDL